MDKRRSDNSEPQGVTGEDFWRRQASQERFAPPTPDAGPAPTGPRLPRRRVGIRKTLPCSVLVKSGSSYILARRVQDISLVGAYVEMPPADLAVGQTVDIVIEFLSGRHPVDHQITAEVSRIDEHGVGLRFSNYGDRAYTDLVNFLYAG